MTRRSAQKPRSDETRARIDEIRKGLREQGHSDTVEDAIAFAVRAVCDSTVAFMRTDDFQTVMASYAAHAVSIALGKPHAPVKMGDGSIGFAPVDGDLPEAPKTH